MNEESNAFHVDYEVDLRGVPSEDVAVKSLDGLKNVGKGNYMLIYTDNYSYIAEIAKAVVTKKAAVDNVLKKSSGNWVVMIKNDVPVAQLDRA